MIRALALLALLPGLALAEAPPPADPPAADPPAVEAGPAADDRVDLDLTVQSASRMGEGQGLLVSVRAENTGAADLLLLLSEAHVVPPDSTEAVCAPDSPRFPAAPVLQILRTEAPGAEACGGSERVPKADWVLSVMRLPAGRSATMVIQVTEPARWTGDLFAHLGVSYTTAERATAAELKRTEKIGLGMMIAGLEPGGRVVAPGEGGPAIRRAVELFDRRAAATPVRID